MRKRLLFALMTMCVAVSGFALTEGEFVYTPQGRFQITGANLNANNSFQDWSGWTVIAAADNVTLADKFNTNANGYAEGLNSVVSLDATASEGMYFKFEPTDAGASYVVSFKMKGAVLDNIRTRVPGDGYHSTGAMEKDNLVKVAGNSAHEYGNTDDEVICNTAEELTEQWQTFNYAIVGDGTSRTYFISFTSMATTIEIADLQIAPAMQFADLRLRDAMLEKMNMYKNCYAWDAAVLADMGYDEAIANLEAIGDENGQPELEEQLATAQEILDDFLKEMMDDYLEGGTKDYNYLGIGVDKMQKVNTIGIWNCIPSGRGHWSVGAYADMGHYAGNTGWCWGAVNDPMGIDTRMNLATGSYVFAIEGKAALREDPTSSSWTINEGWNPAYAVCYVAKVVDGVVTDTIASQVQDIESLNFTRFMVNAKIEEEGNYEFGFKAYCKDAYKDLKNGSVVELKDASIWAKSNNKYKKRELTYEENVRKQITTGRENLTTAAGYLADDTYLWGKAELKACADSIETKIAGYEAMSQDEIIATYDKDIYTNTTSDSTGLLQFEVYQQATKYIIAANKLFVAVNDTLKSMQSTIDNAETTIALRIYDTATGKAELQAAIDKAKGIQAQMKASQYSVENAAIIVATNKELNDAVALFTTTIPAANIVTIADIDFEKAAELDIETFLFTIPGEKGSMLFSTFSEQAASNQEYEKGYWSNGEQLWKGYLRVGNGTGTVTFDPTEGGTMGTNILKVACDFYIQGLSGSKQIGFFLKDAEDVDIFGLYRNYYDGSGTTINTCNADLTKVWSASGSNYNNASPADATDSITPNYALQKTHFEVIMDYGKGTQYCTIASINGSTTSEEAALTAIPAKFVLQCNYNNNERRCWFDNLKIERITAGEYVPSGVDTVKTGAKSTNGVIYNLAGQKVDKSFKGIVVKDGKKMIQK